MGKLKDGCVKPVRGPLPAGGEDASPAAESTRKEEENMAAVKVGKEAVDFEASAFIAGEGFKPVKLSDFRGKWIVLCFYPGDFTFV